MEFFIKVFFLKVKLRQKITMKVLEDLEGLKKIKDTRYIGYYLKIILQIRHTRIVETSTTGNRKMGF